MALRERNMWAGQMADLVAAVRLMERKCGASIEELAQELGVSRRTVFRVKDTLEQLLGGPLDEVPGLLQKEKRFRFPDGFTLNLPLGDSCGLTTPELIALYALRMGTGLFRGSVIQDDVDAAFSKIGKALAPTTRSVLERYGSLCISVPKRAKAYSNHAEIIEELSMAIVGRLTCRITYGSFSGKEVHDKSYEVNPLHFFERDGGLYVFVVVPYYRNIRLLAVERIKKIDPTEQVFDWPEDSMPRHCWPRPSGCTGTTR